MLESSFGDISFFAPPSKDEGFLNRVAQNRLQRSGQNWTPQAFKCADKNSSFKFHCSKDTFKQKLSIQIPAICAGGEGGGGGVPKNNKQTLEKKEGLKAAALLLNISKYREDDSVFFPSNRIKIMG